MSTDRKHPNHCVCLSTLEPFVASGLAGWPISGDAGSLCGGLQTQFSSLFIHGSVAQRHGLMSLVFRVFAQLLCRAFCAFSNK